MKLFLCRSNATLKCKKRTLFYPPLASYSTYDEQSRLAKTSDFVYGAVTEYSYDAFGRVTLETAKQGAEILAQTLYSYDDAAENGQYQKVTKTVVGDENAPSIVTTLSLIHI